MSRRLEIGLSAWQRYELATATPGSDVLEAIVYRLGVSGSWLLTGEGPMFASQAEAPIAQMPAAVPEIDSKLYGRVIEAVSAAYKDSGVTIIPRELGEQAALIYADLINAGGTWDEKMYGLRVSFENLRRQLREALADPTGDAARKLQA